MSLFAAICIDFFIFNAENAKITRLLIIILLD